MATSAENAKKGTQPICVAIQPVGRTSKVRGVLASADNNANWVAVNRRLVR